MNGVRRVAGKQHAVQAGVQQRTAVQSQRQGKLFQNHRQGAAVRAPAGVAADFLIIIQNRHVDAVSLRVRQPLQAGVNRAQIIQPRRGEQILLKAQQRGFGAAVGAQLEGQHVLRLHLQVLGDPANQIAVFLKLALHRAADGQHIHVGLIGHTLVDLPVHVDGHVGDHQQGLVPGDQAALRLHGVVRAQQHHARQSQRPVQPCVENGAAVWLHAQAAAAAGNQLGLGLHPHAGPVGMSRRDPNHVFLSYGHSRQKGAVFHIIPSAPLHRKGPVQRKRLKAPFLQPAGRHFHRMPGRLSAAEPLHQFLCPFSHFLRSFDCLRRREKTAVPRCIHGYYISFSGKTQAENACPPFREAKPVLYSGYISPIS